MTELVTPHYILQKYVAGKWVIISPQFFSPSHLTNPWKVAVQHEMQFDEMDFYFTLSGVKYRFAYCPRQKQEQKEQSRE